MVEASTLTFYVSRFNRMEHQAAVGQHYDELDVFYREIWGEHVHHGLWRTGRETPEEATRQLVDLVVEYAAIAPGEAVCDVGCGYGVTARLLAQEHGARVTALTVSRAQHDYARALGGEVDYRLCDWLANDLPSGAFDVVIAIESVSHMADRRRFFAVAHRVLRPGGRLVACVWLSGEAPRPWERRLLLDPIVREGRLAGLDPASAYRMWLEAAGFVLDGFEDLSRQVLRTWPICLRRLAGRLAADARYRRFLLGAAHENRVFAFTLLRIYAAYRTGAMRYGLFTAHKPDPEDSK